MSKRRAGSDRNSPARPLPLFERSFAVRQVPVFNAAPSKAALRFAIRDMTISREHLAEAMTEVLGRRINRTEIDSWTADSKPGHLPRADELVAFVMVGGDRDGRVAELLASFSGRLVIDRTDAQLLEAARLRRDRAAIDARLSRLERAEALRAERERIEAELAALELSR
jgi:hypothetical protein